MVKINNKVKTTAAMFVVFGIVFFVIIYSLSLNTGINGLVIATKTDPLFSSPELNVDALSKTLKFLKDDQNDLIQAVGLKDEVVATDFISSIPEVKSANDAFIAIPTKENAEHLISSYRNSSKIYRDEIVALRRHLEEAFPGNKEQPFISFGSMTTNKIMQADLAKMLENADQLDREIELRERILNKKSIFNSKRPKLAITQKPSDFVYSEANPPIYANTFPVYLVNSDCFGKSNSQSIFSYLSFNNSDGLATFKPKLANNKYYQKLSAGLEQEKQFIDQGVEWRVITEGNTYRCNNLEYQADLRTIVAFTNEYRDKLLFTDENSQKLELSSGNKKLWELGKSFENKLLTSNNYYSNDDLENLAKYYKYFSDIIGNKSSELSAEFNNRQLFIKNKQSKIEEIINNYFFLDDLYKRALAMPMKDSEIYAKQLYGSRMSYSFAFLNFSNAVWRLQESPQYVGEFTNNDHFATIAEIKQKYTDDLIAKMDEIRYIEVRGY